MASTGKVNWNKNFAPVVGVRPVKVPVKPEGVQGYDEDGRPLVKIAGGQVVEVSDAYDEKTNRVRVKYNNKEMNVRLDSLVKPKTAVSGSMLKPTDFKSIGSTAVSASRLASALVEELQDKKDIDASEREYLIQLVEYWSGKKNSTADMAKSFMTVNPGRLPVIQKYFGEIIGAFACCAKNIVPNVKLTRESKILFPTRTNEPLVDYYIEDRSLFGGRLSVSAKAESSTSNTVKPDNIIKLLESAGKTSKYSSTKAYRAALIIRDNSAIAAPFFLYDLVVKKLPKDLLDYVKSKPKSFLSSRDFDEKVMEPITREMNPTVSITFGQVTAFVEKFALSQMNTLSAFDPSNMFKDAVSGVVVYVKYSAGTKTNPQGVFSVPSHEENAQDSKKFKWRSKNYAARFDDKIGIQP